jgi:hypothetical protein
VRDDECTQDVNLWVDYANGCYAAGTMPEAESPESLPDAPKKMAASLVGREHRLMESFRSASSSKSSKDEH